MEELKPMCGMVHYQRYQHRLLRQYLRMVKSTIQIGMNIRLNLARLKYLTVIWLLLHRIPESNIVK